MLGEFCICRQINVQVDAYICRHIKFMNTHIENGHLITCVGASL
jgi:hypothetical protein